MTKTSKENLLSFKKQLNLSNFKTVKTDSSFIKYLSYNSKNNILIIEFKNGTSYLYQNFSNNEYNELIKAESAGKYFHKHIKNNLKELVLA